MKTYRHPATGTVQQVDDDNKQLIDGLEAQGYVLWDAAAIKAKQDATEKAKQEAAQKLADAQKEMAARYPGAYAEPAENLMPKPLNPNAQVGTDQEIASVTVETKQPSGATDVTSVPKAPAVPKKS